MPDPLILDEGDEGGFVGHTLVPAADGTDGYVHNGYVYLKGATADYKYLQLTYTGSLANTRFEILGDNTYWFDAWQANKFVDVNGNDIDTSYSDEERTIVIDLEKSGAELGWGEGLHIHSENVTANGGLTFVNGYVTKTAPVIQPTTYTVTVDGEKVADVEEGQTYTLGDAAYGYYADGKVYKAGTVLTVTEDIALTSINELSVDVANGAAIKTSTPAGLRFQATVSSDNAEAVKSDAIKEGMLITANDIYENNNSTLDLTSAYKVMNIENQGWFVESTMTYCGAVANISEANYTRDFIARAYVTVTYTDGTSATIYSGMSQTRNVSWVASAIKDAGYPSLGAAEIDVINSFIK